MRTFLEVRKLVLQNTHFTQQLQQLRQELIERIGVHDFQLNHIYDAIENLLDKEADKEQTKLKWNERERIEFNK